jgi:menaquinol-cytochrome c reductase iron-sulfur subunit
MTAPGEPLGSDASPTTDGMSRRRFVVRALAAAGGLIAAALAIPVGAFGTAPGWQSQVPARLISTSVVPTLRSTDWTSVGKVADYEVGVPKYVIVERDVVDGWVQENAPIGVHVVRQDDATAVVFDPHCTHLGCPLAWSDGAGSFVCPCHGGSFDAAGERLAGPPPRAMVRYETKITDGEIYIGTLPEGA